MTHTFAFTLPKKFIRFKRPQALFETISFTIFKVHIVMKKLLTPFLFILSFNLNAQIDTTIGCEAPKNVTKNYKLLAHHLCDDLDTDSQKVNAIYNWVTHQIDYDVKSIHRAKLRSDKPNQVLKRGKTICGGYADLITAMCNEVGVRALTIIGYYKDWKFDEGDKFFIPNHAWNAVMLDNKWEYLDATAGAGYTSLEPNWFQKLMGKINKKKLYTASKPKFVKAYDPKPFLPAIEEFRLERLPADPLWQLSDTSLPLKVFESGKKSIVAFNKNYAQPKQFSVKLSDIQQLKWDERVLESAERTYAFNPRYTSMLARKKYVVATRQAVKAINKSDKSAGRNLLGKAKKELDETKNIQLEQKKTIINETALLKQKNKDKTASFKKYKQKLDRDNKQKLSAIKVKRKQAKAAIGLIDRKRTSLKKKAVPNSVQTISGIKTMSTSKPATNPGLLRLSDSILARSTRLEKLSKQRNQLVATIQNLEEENKSIIGEAANYYSVADSLLYKETVARFEMNDDYDPEVILPQGDLKEVRYSKLNPTIEKFLKNYDSIKTAYKTLLALQTSRESNYKNNLKSIEQYKRQNDKNKDIVSRYSPTISKAQEVRTDYLASLNSYEQSMKNHINIFEVLQKAHDRELEFTRLMNLAEDKRNELEADKIKEDTEWLKAANKKTKKICTQTKKEADRLFKLRHDKKQKRWEKELKKMEASTKSDE